MNGTLQCVPNTVTLLMFIYHNITFTVKNIFFSNTLYITNDKYGKFEGRKLDRIQHKIHVCMVH